MNGGEDGLYGPLGGNFIVVTTSATASYNAIPFVPLVTGEIPLQFADAPAIPFVADDEGSRTLKPAERIDFYRCWRDSSLRLNPTAPGRFLSEVEVKDRGESHRYYYPIDPDYLLSPRWREENLSSPIGLFRWSVEMEAALGLNAIHGYEDVRLGGAFLPSAFSMIKSMEGQRCGYRMINLTVVSALYLYTLLYHLELSDGIADLIGNERQVALAKKADIKNLGQLFSALSNLTGPDGRRWAEVLEYNEINLPAAKLADFLRELIHLTETHKLPFYRFAWEFANLSPAKCHPRFIGIKERVSTLHDFLSQNRREDWPATFYHYLLKTLPFVHSDEPSDQIASRIIDFIETNQERIEAILSDPFEEPLPFSTLRDHFGEFALPVIKFYGGRRGIESKKYGRLKEILALDLPIAQLTLDAFADKSSLTPLEEALIEEERRQLIALKGAIEKLAPTDRTVIQRIFLDGEEPDDVADSLGIGPDEFQHELDRIYAVLRLMIGQEE